MKAIISCFTLFCFGFSAYTQMHTDQNGIKTSITGEFIAVGSQAKRYEIAVVGYNSRHWQYGGILIVELFETYFSSGYEKYSVEIGYMQGTLNTSPELKLIDTQGKIYYAKLELGEPDTLGTSLGGYVNLAIPVYLDIRYYGRYKIKFTYLRNKVDLVTKENEIQINETPTGVDIGDFSVSTTRNELVRYDHAGNHFITGGNVGIGTTLPSNPNNYKFAVKGIIGAHVVIVENSSTTWADYVFEEDYPLMPLSELEAFLKKYKHLPEIPTAEEVGENGHSLGEMNVLLLKKVEELTLYVIEQQKEIEILKNENEIIKESLNKH